MKRDILDLVFKSLIICCLVVITMSTCVFANDLNNSGGNTSLNQGNASENNTNTTNEIMKAKEAKENAHKELDKELIKLAESNESSDKELAKKIWASMKNYQDHSIVLKSPNVPKMIQNLNMSDFEFEIIYNNSCVSGKRYNQLLKYVKTYNQNNIKIKEFKTNINILKKEYNKYLKKLKKDKKRLKKLIKEKRLKKWQKKLYNKKIIKLQCFKKNIKAKEKQYNKHLEKMGKDKIEFEKQNEEREKIFQNEYNYLQELGINSQILELLNNEYKSTVDFLEVCKKYY